MAEIRGGQMAARALKNEGITCIFTLPGGHIASIYSGCYREGIRLIDMRHEQAAAHAADGWARVTGKPGVVVVTAGPGVTNSVTGVTNAFQAGSPTVLLGGGTAVEFMDMGPLQEMDQVELMRPITKWSRKVYETKRIPDFISTAFRYALAGKPGPVFLDCPEDVFATKVDEANMVLCTPHESRTSSKVMGNPDLVRQAADLLLSAKKPVVIASNTVRWSEAGEELREFAESVAAPVFLVAMGRGCLSPDHPNCFVLARRFALSSADVIVLLGASMDFRLNYGRPPLFSTEAKVIQIDIDQTEIGRNRGVEVGILGDAKEVLVQLNHEVQKRGSRKGPEWLEEVRRQETELEKHNQRHMLSDQEPIHPLRLLKEVRDFLDRDAIIVGDGGDIVSHAAQVLKTYYPGHWLDPGRFGCLGVGTGFAIAAKVAKPDKQVLLISGDGAFGFNGMEFDTAVRHGIPIVAVVGNNRAWGRVPEGKKTICTELVGPRYDKMVESLGGYGEYVERPEDIRPALERAFASGTAACVNVILDQHIGYEHVTGGTLGVGQPV